MENDRSNQDSRCEAELKSSIMDVDEAMLAVFYARDATGNTIKAIEDITNSTKETIKAQTRIIEAAEEVIKRLSVAKSNLDDALLAQRIELTPQKQATSLMSLPPEIRIMIYRCILVSCL